MQEDVLGFHVSVTPFGHGPGALMDPFEAIPW